MVALIFLCLNLVASFFKSKSRLEAENAALRHQLIVLQRKIRGRVHFTNSDRLFFIQLYRWCPSVLKAMMVIRPETLVRWHRAGFRRYWRWKSRSAGGRPQIHAELRALIWRMSVDNRLWGAPHIHGELLKLGFAVAQSTVAKYMAKRGNPSGQSWGALRQNLLPGHMPVWRARTRARGQTANRACLRPVLCHFLLATRSQSARLFSRGLPSTRFAQLNGAVFPTDGGLFGEG
jgi:hypothetical protein